MTLRIREGTVLSCISESSWTWPNARAAIEVDLFIEDLRRLKVDAAGGEVQQRLVRAGLPVPSVGQLPFLSGFLPLLYKRLHGVHHTTDGLSIPHLHNGTLPTLRPYQEAARHLAVTQRRGLLAMGTGAGKTRTVAAVIQTVGHRWLYLVHRASLREQTTKALRDLELRAYGLEETDRPPQDREVLVATYQSLINRPNEYLRVEGLIVDEAHRAASEEYAAVIMRAHTAVWRLGPSATPLDRADGLDPLTIGLLGPVLYEKPLRELQQDGTLTQGRVVFHPYRSDVRLDHVQSWQDTRERGIVANSVRNELIVELVKTSTPPIFVLVLETVHGLRLRHAILQEGMDVEFVEGANATSLRERHLEALRSGKIKAIVATSVFDEGVDVPQLRTVINAAGGKSTIQAIQRLGRAVRKLPGKTDFTFHDFIDDGNDWLRRHTRLRAETYQALLGIPIEGSELIPGFVETSEEDQEEQDELVSALRQRDGVTRQLYDPWGLAEPCTNLQRRQQARTRRAHRDVQSIGTGLFMTALFGLLLFLLFGLFGILAQGT